MTSLSRAGAAVLLLCSVSNLSHAAPEALAAQTPFQGCTAVQTHAHVWEYTCGDILFIHTDSELPAELSWRTARVRYEGRQGRFVQPSSEQSLGGRKVKVASVSGREDNAPWREVALVAVQELESGRSRSMVCEHEPAETAASKRCWSMLERVAGRAWHAGLEPGAREVKPSLLLREGPLEVPEGCQVYGTGQRGTLQCGTSSLRWMKATSPEELKTFEQDFFQGLQKFAGKDILARGAFECAVMGVKTRCQLIQASVGGKKIAHYTARVRTREGEALFSCMEEDRSWQTPRACQQVLDVTAANQALPFLGCTATLSLGLGWSYLCGDFTASIHDQEHPEEGRDALWKGVVADLSTSGEQGAQQPEQQVQMGHQQVRLQGYVSQLSQERRVGTLALVELGRTRSRIVSCSVPESSPAQARCKDVLERALNMPWRWSAEAGSRPKRQPPSVAFAGRPLSAPDGCKLSPHSDGGRIACGTRSQLDWVELRDPSQRESKLQQFMETFREELPGVPLTHRQLPCRIGGVETQCQYLRDSRSASGSSVYIGGAGVRGKTYLVACLSENRVATEALKACEPLLSLSTGP